MLFWHLTFVKKYLFLRFLILFFVFLFFFFSMPSLAQDLLKNSGFEEGLVNNIPKYWGEEYYNSSLLPDRGGNVLKIINDSPKMSLGAQTIAIDWRKISKVTLSAWIKSENVVQGNEDWNQANIQLLFFDEKDVQVGGWPSVGAWTGSFGWKYVARNIIVPKGTVKAKVVFGLYDCAGTVYFDDIKLVPLPDQKNTDPYNFLENGGLEVWEKWAYGGSEDWAIINNNVKVGNGALRIRNSTPVWSFVSQSVSVDGRKAKKIKLSGYIKAKDVIPGVKPWQLARINIEFKDGKGKRLDGWPILEAFSGTFDWKFIENEFNVPKETRRIDVFAGLLECAGEAWFDEIKLIAFDNEGKKLQPGGIYVTDTKDWNEFIPLNESYKKTVSDVSFLLDSPAGKHGFLKVKNGHFYFEDGTRVRFWGTNIYAPSTFPEKHDAEIMAERLARSGCNLVRIHHIDAFWSNPNIFDQNYDDTQHLSKESFDKLDYLIYQLKRRGIYVFMDLLVDREFKKGDNVKDWQNVERGAKVTGFFDNRIIELQKKYAEQILTHKNPYTGLRYVDDPALVSVKLINEAMLFYFGTQFNISKHYLTDLDGMFNEWLLKRYKNRNNLDKTWTDKYGRKDLKQDEDPYRKNVQRADIPLKYQRSGAEKYEPSRLADTLKFYEELQVKYYKEMSEYLKKLGVKVPISGSNHWVNLYVDVKTNSSLDYIDRHRYWDHPQFGYGTQVVFENLSMLQNPVDALPNNFAFYNVSDIPFVVSEWNCCFPNEFRVEGPLVMAAYANLQDWDGVIQFSFNHAGWQAPMEDNFDVSAWPNVYSQLPAAALLFYRGDVAEARKSLNYPVSDSELYGLLDEDKMIAGNPYLPYILKTTINFKGKINSIPKDYVSKYHDKQNRIISSDTGELKLDYGKGIFTINSDRTEVAMGFMKNRIIQLNDFIVEPENEFCSIAFSVLNDKLKFKKIDGGTILVTVAAKIENKNQEYNESKTQLANVGDAPLLTEGVEAKITFKGVLPRRISALDINGDIIKTIPLKGRSFYMDASDKAFFYEMIF